MARRKRVVDPILNESRAPLGITLENAAWGAVFSVVWFVIASHFWGLVLYPTFAAIKIWMCWKDPQYPQLWWMSWWQPDYRDPAE